LGDWDSAELVEGKGVSGELRIAFGFLHIEIGVFETHGIRLIREFSSLLRDVFAVLVTRPFCELEYHSIQEHSNSPNPNLNVIKPIPNRRSHFRPLSLTKIIDHSCHHTSTDHHSPPHKKTPSQNHSSHPDQYYWADTTTSAA